MREGRRRGGKRGVEMTRDENRTVEKVPIPHLRMYMHTHLFYVGRFTGSPYRHFLSDVLGQQLPLLFSLCLLCVSIQWNVMSHAGTEESVE
jgi:hypothetical protein